MAVFAAPILLAAFFFGSTLGGSAWEQWAWTVGLFLGGMVTGEFALRAIEAERPPST